MGPTARSSLAEGSWSPTLESMSDSRMGVRRKTDAGSLGGISHGLLVFSSLMVAFWAIRRMRKKEYIQSGHRRLMRT